MKLSPVHGFLLMIFLSRSCSCVNFNTLKAVLVVFKHEESLPIKQEDSFLWPGVNAHSFDEENPLIYQLGQWLRQRYDSFLPQNYSLENIYVRSTDRDRALMSALTFLSGLYQQTKEHPHVTWQPSPIARKHLTGEISSRPSTEFENLCKELLKIRPFNTPDGLTEDIFAYKLPTWIIDIHPDRLKPWTLFSGANRMQCYLPTLSQDVELSLESEIMRHFLISSKYDDSSYERFKVYSAHGSTADNVLTTIDQSITYGAAVFELHSNGNTHSVSILCKNASELSETSLEEREVIYSLEQFLTILEPITRDDEKWETIYTMVEERSVQVFSCSCFIITLVFVMRTINFKIYYS